MAQDHGLPLDFQRDRVARAGQSRLPIRQQVGEILCGHTPGDQAYRQLGLR